MQSILFVCVGNICRSPCLEAVMKVKLKERGLSDKVFVDSCGTSSYHVGCQVNAKMKHFASLRGIELDHIAKKFDPVFLDAFDYIFAVDSEVKEFLLSYSSPENKDKIFLATAFSQKCQGNDIPDPYYGGEEGFIDSIDMAEDCCLSILEALFTE
ncbi:MAG: low molecular weight phosphotyrosine protein phosphatase [Chlamydiae bacterium]|nr:low molecular weight phosphotyrosine protein phosphatase [Chlamydiota bacterium]